MSTRRWAIVFLGLTTAAFASATLDVLVNAAASFSATIRQQLEMLQSNPSPAKLAEKTIDYAEAKEAYFKALRAEIPELMKIATGKEERPPELDTFAAAFAVALAKTRRRTKGPWFGSSDSHAILTLRRQGRNSTVRKRSKRNTITISMGRFLLIDKSVGGHFYRANVRIANTVFLLESSTSPYLPTHAVYLTPKRAESHDSQREG